MATMEGRRGVSWRVIGWGGALALLALPFVAMLFTREVAWSPFDFVVFGAMILLAGGAWELLMRASASMAYRLAAGIAVAAGFLLIWVNLAVGIIGAESEVANLLFGGVLLVAVAGAVAVRGRAAGMAATMLATVAAQGIVAVIGVSTGWAVEQADGLAALAGATMVFGLMWLLAAALFWKAAGEA